MGDDLDEKCDRCPAPAVWSVLDYPPGPPDRSSLYGQHACPESPSEPTWFACGRHLHQVLTEAQWMGEDVGLMDLRRPAGI